MAGHTHAFGLAVKKLLIVTQALDLDDPVLGVYHDWLLSLAPQFGSIELICLKLGRHTLPQNVHAHSLGKENGRRSRLVTAWRFLAVAWRTRPAYDTVFVHMNQEYVLLGGLLWKILGKPVYFWRNHGSGSFLTRIAGMLSRTVFYTSTASYTARFNNAKRMPVGVDTVLFLQETSTHRMPGSILMVGRIAPRKHVRDVVEALIALQGVGAHPSLTLVGDTAPEHEAYRDGVMSLASAANIGLSVRGGVPHADLPRIYQEHDIVVNVSEPGMFDKTMLEALASGCLLLTRHEDLARELDPRQSTTGDVPDIAQKLHALQSLPVGEREALEKEGWRIAEAHSLETLARRLAGMMSV